MGVGGTLGPGRGFLGNGAFLLGPSGWAMSLKAGFPITKLYTDEAFYKSEPLGVMR